MADKNYLSNLISEAMKQYPFLAGHDPHASLGHGPYYAETYGPGEEGDTANPRPKEFPINSTGVKVYRPDQFGPSDYAAEFLHIDPFANMTRNYLQQSLSLEQIRRLQHESRDYSDSLAEGQTKQKAMTNAVDAAMRGYAVGQWPKEANAAMRYTSDQTNLLQSLASYMKQGYYPLNYSLPKGR